MRTTSAVLMLSCGAAAVTAVELSPVQKVVDLLANLKAQVLADQAAELSAEEEYIKWADKTEWEKTKAIDDGQKQINELSADIEDASAAVSSLTSEIETGTKNIARAENDLQAATTIRDSERSHYQHQEAELVSTIDTLERARIVLKKHLEHDGKQAGAALLQSAEPQIRALLQAISHIVSASWITVSQRQTLQALLQEPAGDDDELSWQNPQAKAYESHSGSILDTLAELQDKAEEALSAMRTSELNAQHAFELLKQSLTDEITVMQKQLTTNQQAKSQHEERRSVAEKDLAGVTKGKAEDEKYLAELQQARATRTADHQANVESFNGEVRAIDEAVGVLSGKEVVAAMGERGAAVALLQFHDTPAINIDSRARAASTLLAQLGSRFHSQALAHLAQRARTGPFDKVRGMISEMINRLTAQAAEEADHNSWCNDETKKSEEKIADRREKLNRFTVRFEADSASIERLRQEITTLENEISQLDTAQQEATAMRLKEKDAYAKTKADAETAIAALQSAITILRNYYGGTTALTQQAPPNILVRRTNADNAGASTGIIGLLEVSESDFSRTLAEATTAESEAQKSYDTLSQETAVSRATKIAESKGKEAEIKSLETSRNNAAADRDGTQAELDAVVAYFDTVKEQCIYKVPTFEERAARREAEIAGLHNALEILSSGASAATTTTGFMQKRAEADVRSHSFDERHRR